VGINFKEWLYVNSSFVFINNQLSTEYAAAIVEGGYQFKNKSGNGPEMFLPILFLSKQQ